MTTLVDLLKTIADDKPLAMFNTTRLSALLKAGVVKRVRGKNSLTSCGAILYHAQELIGKAVNQYSHLKAIDYIRESGNCDFPQEQFYVITDKLIASQEIKNILLKHFKGESSLLRVKRLLLREFNLGHECRQDISFCSGKISSGSFMI
jgi:hypothetical protein